MTLSAGTRLGPYEILAPVGAGGMGEIYRARDRRLGREVAIKVLPAELARDPSAVARFQREARAVASLTHPNVLDLHDFGTEDGVCYVVTELLEGETLRERLANGPLRWTEAVDVGLAIAEGLAAAHARGVVHRDLKPANIFRTKDGRIKILDFGLARMDAEPLAEDRAELPTATETGTLLGTVGYMSPEQVRGERVDARSDIFSFGCVLFEMLAGAQAFRGPTSAETMVAILREEPADSLAETPEIPIALRRVVAHCLAKDPNRRIQSARDLVLSLKDVDPAIAPSDAASPPLAGRFPTSRALTLGIVIAAIVLAILYGWRRTRGIDSLAVLPFVNASPDPGEEYLSDGLSENLINRFSRFSELRVPPRTTVATQRGEKDPRKAGRALDVAAVLAGRVSRHGDDLLIQVELVDVRRGSQLWGERYERKAADLLGVEESIAREISQRLRIRPTGSQAAVLARKPTEDPEAYDLYLQGRYYWNKRGGEDVVRSVDLFERAIHRDPHFAMAFAGLAEAYDLIAFYGGLPPKDVLPKAKDAANRALQIDDSLADAHAALADVRYQFDWDWTGAEQGFRRALLLNPRSATAHQWYSNLLSVSGRFQESFREIETARRLDPLDLMIRTDEGLAQHWAGHDDKAREILESTLRLEPGFPMAHLYLGLVEIRQNALDSAIGEADIARKLLDGEPDPIALYGYACALAGRRAEASEAMRRLEDLSRHRFVDSVPMAVLSAGMGEKDRALSSLERAYEERSGRLVYLKVERAFDPIRDDSRFRSLLERLRFPS